MKVREGVRERMRDRKRENDESPVVAKYKLEPPRNMNIS